MKNIEKALSGAPPEVEEFVRSIVRQLEVVNGDFEEQLLDRELWSSVDLLQNMGIKHHALFDEVIGQIQSGAEVEVVKDRVRRGRVALGDWLFIDELSGFFMQGRSDAALNRNGIRIGTSEIYSALQVQRCPKLSQFSQEK